MCLDLRLEDFGGVDRRGTIFHFQSPNKTAALTSCSDRSAETPHTVSSIHIFLAYSHVLFVFSLHIHYLANCIQDHNEEKISTHAHHVLRAYKVFRAPGAGSFCLGGASLPRTPLVYFPIPGVFRKPCESWRRQCCDRLPGKTYLY